MRWTAKFSEQFYRKLGHETVDELVDWLNQVDTAYRGELREINDSNFARFDAKLEQRLTQVEERLGRRLGDVRVELVKWMFLFWVGNFATTAGLMVALVHFTRP